MWFAFSRPVLVGLLVVTSICSCRAILDVTEGQPGPPEAGASADALTDTLLPRADIGRDPVTDDVGSSDDRRSETDTITVDGRFDVVVEAEASSDALVPDAGADISTPSSSDAGFNVDVGADAQTCSDPIRKCGGACPPCRTGAACVKNSDCITGACRGEDAGTCTPWSKVLFATGDVQISAEVQDANGNLFVVGDYSGTPGGDLRGPPSTNGARVGFVLKFSFEGEELKPTYNPGISWRRIALDSSNTPVVFGDGTPDGIDAGKAAGGTDLILAKLDAATLQPSWVRVYGGTGNEGARDLAIGRDDSIVIAADSTKGVWALGDAGVVPDPGLPSESVAIFARVRSDGQPLWPQFVSYGGSVLALSSKVNSAGDLDIAGVLAGVNGTVGDSGTRIADAGQLLRSGDIFVLQMAAANGAIHWSHGYPAGALGSHVGPLAAQLAIVGNEGLWAAGVLYGRIVFAEAGVGSAGQLTPYVARFNWEGRELWAKSIGECGRRAGEAAGHWSSFQITVDEHGLPLFYGTFVCGSITLKDPIENAGALGGDLVVAQIDPNGGGFGSYVKWQSPDHEQLVQVVVNARNGNMLLIGHFENTINFGDGVRTKPNATGQAAFVVSAGGMPLAGGMRSRPEQ